MIDSAFHDFEQAGWERAAEHYPHTFGALTIQTVDPLLDAVQVAPAMKVLDVATGPGYAAGAAAARGADAVGIDFSDAMIAEARRRFANATFELGEAEGLQFVNGRFDAVVMNFGVLHLARPEAAFSEAFRVLRSGGRYAFTGWAHPDEARGFGIVLRAVETYGTSDVGLPPGPPFFRFSDPDECRRSLHAAGFTEVQVRQVPLVWRLPSADAVFEAVSRGGVRTAALLRAQTPDALQAIREAAARDARAFANGGIIALPMPAVLAYGVKA